MDYLPEEVFHRFRQRQRDLWRKHHREGSWYQEGTEIIKKILYMGIIGNLRNGNHLSRFKKKRKNKNSCHLFHHSRYPTKPMSTHRFCNPLMPRRLKKSFGARHYTKRQSFHWFPPYTFKFNEISLKKLIPWILWGRRQFYYWRNRWVSTLYLPLHILPVWNNKKNRIWKYFWKCFLEARSSICFLACRGETQLLRMITWNSDGRLDMGSNPKFHVRK